LLNIITIYFFAKGPHERTRCSIVDSSKDR